MNSMSYIKVENNPGLVRDANSNGIVNVDDASYAAYKKIKLLNNKKVEKEKLQEAKINNLEERVCNMENMLTQILDILKHDNTK